MIDETEFLQWIARIQALRESPTTSTAEDDDLTQDLVAAFRVFDRDNNGYITLDELQRAMQMIGENVTETQLNEMLALADLDKDGRINYEGEFKNFNSVKNLHLMNFDFFLFQNLHDCCCKVKLN